jgi:GNAT superfamily N-acetyltransferase
MPVPVPDALEVVSLADDPAIEGAAEALVVRCWPEFMRYSVVAGEWFDPLFARFPELQVALRRREDGAVVGWANTVPVPWDGTDAGLPDAGWDWAISVGVARGRAGAGALSALQAVVEPDLRGRGLAGVLLGQMHLLAGRLGLGDLVAPVRPTAKAADPLGPMEPYARRTRPDGAPADPWLRAHWRLGGRVVRVAPRSFGVRGSLAEWRRWTGLALDRPGPHAVPGAIAPVVVDRDAGVASYVEPNVWMHHPVRAG